MQQPAIGTLDYALAQIDAWHASMRALPKVEITARDDKPFRDLMLGWVIPCDHCGGEGRVDHYDRHADEIDEVTCGHCEGARYWSICIDDLDGMTVRAIDGKVGLIQGSWQCFDDGTDRVVTLDQLVEVVS